MTTVEIKLPIFYKTAHHPLRRKVRELYIEKQGGLCYYCKHPINKEPPEFIMKKSVTKHLFPRNFFVWPIHLHHSHVTGMTLGAVHNYCNAVLWEYEGE